MNLEDPSRQPFFEAVWSKLITQPNGCWQWTGCTKGGYAYAHRNRRVHRLVYELMIGPIPAGLVTDHLCRNRGCCNPTHLELVTNRENVLRGTGPTADRARQTHCRNGHPLSGDNVHIYKNHEATKRLCLTCHRVNWKRANERKKQRRQERRLATSHTLLALDVQESS